jgi:hypothetical protein
MVIVSFVNRSSAFNLRSVRNVRTAAAVAVSGFVVIGGLQTLQPGQGRQPRLSNIETATPTLTTKDSGLTIDGVDTAPDRTVWAAH